MNATDIMVSNVITVRPDTSISEIAEVLLANRISAVPVVDENDALVGIVSEGDLIHRVENGTERHLAWWLEFLTSRDIMARDFVKSHARKAADVMARPVVTVNPDTPLGKVADLLEKHRIKRVPVVNNGKIVGIVSRADLVRALISRVSTAAADAPIDDSTLYDNLLAQLRLQRWRSDDVSIIVRNGIVELWGVVETEAERDAVRIAAETTPGVHKVANNLGIGRWVGVQ